MLTMQNNAWFEGFSRAAKINPVGRHLQGVSPIGLTQG
jgi:hypothetical protein